MCAPDPNSLPSASGGHHPSSLTRSNNRSDRQVTFAHHEEVCLATADKVVGSYDDRDSGASKVEHVIQSLDILLTGAAVAIRKRILNPAPRAVFHRAT
ncbi:hypothetical protein PGT21_018714 [Puccinia graminis f. sp. tritici]|uniref:Uncharacterized protein n=1 Tax=Puccinia graminis f. sp. tritici TaxID=56615 RepID=A0A5B0Q2P4_PUCGR|nr:hypothetical protein PGT21_018714 [Puccinia graminis f. sp. tritici]